MNTHTSPARSRPDLGFTLVELLIVITIIVVLSAIAFPMVKSGIQSAKNTRTITQLRQVSALAISYSIDQNSKLPTEGGEGVQSFANLGKAENASAWYNVLPEMAGQKPAKDYRSSPKDFYNANNMLFLDSAIYPKNRTTAAYFAFGINSQLNGARMTSIDSLSRTALFAEARLPDEKLLAPTSGSTSGTDLGQPKVRDKRFVSRYRTSGIVAFADGHTESVPVSKVYDTSVVMWEATTTTAQN